MACKHGVRNASQGVHISAPIDVLAADLFRSHVIQRAQKVADGSHSGSGCGPLREAEVSEINVPAALGIALGQEDVSGFDVAMDKSGLVSGVEGCRGVGKNAQGFGQRERPALLKFCLKIGAVYEAHGDV